MKSMATGKLASVVEVLPHATLPGLHWAWSKR